MKININTKVARKLVTLLFILILSMSIVYAVDVSTCSQLQNIRLAPASDYDLINDIDCTGTNQWNNYGGFIPISSFSGSLDGHSFTITGVFLSELKSPRNNFGMFNDSSGEIKNIIFDNFTIQNSTSNNVGFVANNSGNITNVQILSGFVGCRGCNFIGGLAGVHYDGIISFSSANLDVNTTTGVGMQGGLVGEMGMNRLDKNPTLLKSKFSGNITGKPDTVGGLVGRMHTGEIRDSYVNALIQVGTTTGTSGGLVGQARGGLMENSYSRGTLTYLNMVSTDYVGGLIGLSNISILRSYSVMVMNTTGGTLSNGSIAGSSNSHIIDVHWLTTNLYFTSFPCVSNRTGGILNCPSEAPESYFFNYANEPLDFWNFENVWSDSREGNNHPILAFEVGLIPEDRPECVLPLLFCDDFDYSSPLRSTGGWGILQANDDINSLFSPTNDEVLLNSSNPKTLNHPSKSFPVNYTRSGFGTVIESIYAPSFSNEFDISTNLSSRFEYFDIKTKDIQGDECYHIRFQGNLTNGINISIHNHTGQGQFEFVNIGRMEQNEGTHIKITSRFKGQLDLFNFNTSYTTNHILMWANDTAFHKEGSLERITFPDECDSIYNFRFEKLTANAEIKLDNYFMYYGTDKYTPTIYEDAITTPEAPQDAIIQEGNLTSPTTGFRDVGQGLDTVVLDIGLISTRSKVLASIFILFVVTIAMIGGFISANMQPNFSIITIVNVIVMIGLAYFGLLPKLALLVLGIVACALGLLAFKYSAVDG